MKDFYCLCLASNTALCLCNIDNKYLSCTFPLRSRPAPPIMTVGYVTLRSPHILCFQTVCFCQQGRCGARSLPWRPHSRERPTASISHPELLPISLSNRTCHRTQTCVIKYLDVLFLVLCSRWVSPCRSWVQIHPPTPNPGADGCVIEWIWCKKKKKSCQEDNRHHL